MRNVWLIFRRDFFNLFRNVMSVIITIGLVLLPSLFAWYNILASWDVFNNLGNLSIAVANDDAGYTSDIMPINVNIGEDVVSALRANDQINWVITDSNDAIEGTKSGKYYASIVIPENFSHKMLTFYEGDSESANLTYYVNEKKNAISPNITSAGVDTVSYQVNSTFAETLSKVAAGLAKSVSQYAQSNDVGEGIALLSDRMRSAANRIDQTADVMALYSSLAKDSKELVENSATLVKDTKDQAKKTLDKIDEDKQSLSNVATNLGNVVDNLADSLENNTVSLSDIEGKIDSLLDSASQDSATIAGVLRDKASEIDDQISALESHLAELEDLRDALQNGIGTALDKVIDSDLTETEIKVEIEFAMERTVLLDKAISTVSQEISILQEASNDLSSAADSLESGNSDIQNDLSSLRDSVDNAEASISNLKSEFESNLESQIATLRNDLENLSNDLSVAAENLAALSSGLPGLTDKTEKALTDAGSKVDAVCDKLSTAAEDIRTLADSVDAALSTGDLDLARTLLAGETDSIAAALTAPVQIDRQPMNPVANFGSAMTPLYLALALFIGSLLIMVAMKPAVSERGLEELTNPKPRQLYFGRFGVVAVVSLLQTTALGLGSMLFLGVQVNNPILFQICCWITGLVFAFIVYTLVVAFGNLGKAIAVLMLIVQVTGCGGSYPLPIMPDFVQIISPWLPATHVVNAMRAAMFGVYQNDFWISMGTLLLFLIPFLLLGLVLRKLTDRFMRFYVEKVEESKLVE